MSDASLKSCSFVFANYCSTKLSGAHLLMRMLQYKRKLCRPHCSSTLTHIRRISAVDLFNGWSVPVSGQMMSRCHGEAVTDSRDRWISRELPASEAGHENTRFHVNYLSYHRYRRRFYKKPRAIEASRFSNHVKRRRACGGLGRCNFKQLWLSRNQNFLKEDR